MLAITLATAQSGKYESRNGGYQILLNLQPKGTWTFQSAYLGRPNKRGQGRWKRVGKQLQLTVYQNGRALKGRDAVGLVSVEQGGKILRQRTAGREFVFRKVAG